MCRSGVELLGSEMRGAARPISCVEPLFALPA
ncbi:Uncharacterised protein [Pseudomonas aeruginosa]|nr:Uncharacterised protein [Pseudomonas aeruginosa]VTM12596.1 Uncharacterised protein [Pseudomonas aeruginosa]